MFTGLVQKLGEVLAIEKQAASLRLAITMDWSDVVLGESIALDGVCLTVVKIEPGVLYFDISAETLACSNLSALCLGQYVNVERALAVGERFGGHFVLGHVDTKARLLQKTQIGDYCVLTFGEIDKKYYPLLVSKGSIAVNGVSLTLNAISPEGFSVMLVPHTLAKTALVSVLENAWVNIEFDYLIKAVLQNSLICEEEKNGF